MPAMAGGVRGAGAYPLEGMTGRGARPPMEEFDTAQSEVSGA